jgi:predicted amidohydrolase
MPTKIRVVTTTQQLRYFPSIDANLDYMLDLLGLACTRAPDIVCLPESFATAGLELKRDEKYLPVPNQITDACAKRAKLHRCYVICPVLRRANGKYFNSAAILDRAGQVFGIYDKIHLPYALHEDDQSVPLDTPGPLSQCFDLDFGRIGIRICFDVEYPETWKQMEDEGVKLAFWPSAFDGGLIVKAYAYQHSYFVVSSVRSRVARIIDPLGRVLEETGRRFPIVWRDIDLDFICCPADYHVGVWPTMLREYGPGVNLSVLQEEGVAMLSTNGDLPLSRVVKEFGVTSRKSYIDQYRPVLAALREGREPKVTEPLPYEGRPGYRQITLEEWKRLRAEFLEKRHGSRMAE